MFNEYSDKIKQLTGFEKEDILNKTFELYRCSNFSIYYAPHNEIINKKARVFIVGITPGWTQTKIAYKTAYFGLQQNLPYELIKKECKVNSRFAGSMRKNLVEMLDNLNLNDKLKLTSCAELFEGEEDLLHTTSLIPYPVFINEKNYTGSKPKIMENETLYSYVRRYFFKEIESLPNAFIIPLGRAVEEVLQQMIKDNLISKEQCLLGFPHPSGANGHRKNQFIQNRDGLLNVIEAYFARDKRTG
ncbi:MAG: hypothetical protein IJ716_09275 [Lachnospiraceae bacterium]|nr:hypothetical protein [Lachnospiraceae bacterium]